MVECNSLSMSIIICLVWSNIAIDGVKLSLGGCLLFMFVDFVFVCVGVVVSWEYCYRGSLETLPVLVLHVFDVCKV